MKPLIIVFICMSFSLAKAQTNTGSTPWKGYNDVFFVYRGELKNGIPDGKGMALSEGGGWMKLFGDFKNGKFTGSGVMILGNGSIIAGNWNDNLPEGLTVQISPEKTVLYGNGNNNTLYGKVVELKADETINIGDMDNGKYIGRLIHIPWLGQSIYDTYRTTKDYKWPGYYFTLGVDHRFSGYFDKDYTLIGGEQPVNYTSFMQSDSMKGYQIRSNAWWIVSNTVMDSGNRYPQDTCLFADNTTRTRKFGNFRHGELVDGIVMSNDSLRVIGHFNTNGMLGEGVIYKKDDYLVFGNFNADKMNGRCLFIDIKDTTVMNGVFVNNMLTGTAAIVSHGKEIQIGTFYNSMLNGEGTVINVNGNTSSGIYVNGELAATKKGATTNTGNQASQNEAIQKGINFLLKESETNFATITTKKKLGTLGYSLVIFQSGFNFPGCFNSAIIKDTMANTVLRPFFYGLVDSYTDLGKAKEQYGLLCEQVAACDITSLQQGKALRFKGEESSPAVIDENNSLITEFTVVNYNKKHPPQLNVKLEKTSNGNYNLLLIVVAKK